MRISYGVVWRQSKGPLARGKLELLARGLRLDGVAGADRVTREIPYEQLAAVHVGRSSSERLNGHAALVLELRSGDPISITGVAQPGVVAELAERLAGLSVGNGTKAVVILPLKDGAHDEARRLLEAGPPFDPASTELDEHEVFLGEHEVVFTFEAAYGKEALEPLLSDVASWRGAAAWGEYLAGPPRLAETVYSWSRS